MLFEGETQMSTQMSRLLFGLVTLAIAGAVQAKLPAPTPEAAATAAAAKDKAAWGDKVAAYQLCLVQDKTVAYYQKTKGAKKSSIETPPCADPGPYVPAQAATGQVGVADSKPVPEAGKPAEPAAKK
jgi:hypothetical protein